MTRRVTHGRSRTPLYKIWIAMHRRCKNPSQISYRLYGARGIYVDPAWDDFAVFLADMGERPEGASLDRIDNEGPYSKANCRWATLDEQLMNRSCTRAIEVNGQRLVLRDVERSLGVSRGTVSMRLLHGWTPEDAVSRPKFWRPNYAK